MKRREFLAVNVAGAATISANLLSRPASASSFDSAPGVTQLDDINPRRIRTAGIRMIPVVKGKYKVWTKRIGEGPIKVLLLHGGPGFGHEYLEAMEAFLPQAGIELIYYDQLGNNNSDQPDAPDLWTLPRYLQEVEEVRVGLELEDFVLYGHSWGGILAIEYALHFPQYLRGLVISNMTASIDDYLKRTAYLKHQLPASTLARLEALEAEKAYDSAEYQKIMAEDLYPSMLCRIFPWPEPVQRSFRHANQSIYNAMQGKSEFVVTGNLKGWNRWDRLHEITTKTLTIGATYDEMDPTDLIKMAKMMPNAASVICPRGSHMSMWDDQAFYFENLLAFLRTL